MLENLHSACQVAIRQRTSTASNQRWHSDIANLVLESIFIQLFSIFSLSNFIEFCIVKLGTNMKGIVILFIVNGKATCHCGKTNRKASKGERKVDNLSFWPILAAISRSVTATNQPTNEPEFEPIKMSRSQCRQNFHEESEAGINKQINMELTASYIYQAMSLYCDRDDVAHPNTAKFFKKSSDEEREHAEKLMKYQNKRGGRIVLQDIKKPEVIARIEGFLMMLITRSL